MQFSSTSVPYQSTGFFADLVSDYLDENELLQPLYKYALNEDGLNAAIDYRKANNATNRTLLVNVLSAQYANVENNVLALQQIEALEKENTFTVCTAHQPNIFTGPLYFIYKILHAIQLANHLNQTHKDLNFIPVYYMGSEDADIEELGHFHLNGTKYTWATQQTGAVGRMKVDKGLVELIDTISGQVSIFPFGNEILTQLKACYTIGTTIEQATFLFVHHVFAQYGLLILLPDNAPLKAEFTPILKKELLESFSAPLVENAVQQFPEKYKVTANGRSINLFYLLEDKRERIEKQGSNYVVLNTAIQFTEAEILQELETNPERFSPNVVLRPVFQETILPNVAFIGGGGEIAYWLQLKGVFDAVNIPFPLLVLRNSFLMMNDAAVTVQEKLQISTVELFQSAVDLLTQYTKQHSTVQLHLENEKQQLNDWYKNVQTITTAINDTLPKHVKALQTKALKKIEALEKKMLRAEKKKQDAAQRQIAQLKSSLFPNNSLQERVENMLPFYAKYGQAWIDELLHHSKILEQQFTVLKIEA